MWPSPNRTTLYSYNSFPSSPKLLPDPELSDAESSIQDKTPTLEFLTAKDQFVSGHPQPLTDETDWRQDDLRLQALFPMPGAEVAELMNQDTVDLGDWMASFRNEAQPAAPASTRAPLATEQLPPPLPMPFWFHTAQEQGDRPNPFQIPATTVLHHTETPQQPRVAPSSFRLPSIAELAPGFEHLFGIPAPEQFQASQSLQLCFDALMNHVPVPNPPLPQTIQPIEEPNQDAAKPQAQKVKKSSKTKNKARNTKAPAKRLPNALIEEKKAEVLHSHFQDKTLPPSDLAKMHNTSKSNVTRWLAAADPKWDRQRKARRTTTPKS